MSVKLPNVSIEYDGDLWILKFDDEFVEAYTTWAEAVEDIKPQLANSRGGRVQT